VIVLTLPFPPSANAYVRHADGHRHYFTPEANAFRKDVARIVALARIQPLVGRLSIELRLSAPNRRKVDIDNRIKAALDALMHAGCFADDEAIDHLHVHRERIVKGGLCAVRIAVCASVPEQIPLPVPPVLSAKQQREAEIDSRIPLQ
jgi:crossover junction endodeoxyribonuclease RusA